MSNMADESNERTALVPVREAQVEFYGDSLAAAQLADGTILVPVRPLCEYLGLTWSGQFERLKQNPVLSEALQIVRVTRTNAGDPNVLCLPLKFLPGWLFGIQASRVKPALRDKILRYQRECYDVLWNAFKDDVVPSAAPAPPDLSPVEQALMLAEAVASMAREHLALEQRFTTMADYTRGYIQQSRRQLADHEDRLTALELHVSGGTTISEAQAAELQQAVKQLAMALHQRTEQPVSTAFQLVWGELYKRYRVGAYRNLPAARYDDALSWLQGWYEELQKDPE
jgi:hypothetical protein